MLRASNKLTILHDDNSSFTDYSNEALDFSRDHFTITLNSSEDYLYVGFDKPINTFFIELVTANTNANDLTVQFYNGTAWSDVTGLYDETKGMTRSGFIRWDRNQTDEEEVTVNSIEKFFIRIRPSVTHSPADIAGINLVFSDDNDLKRLNPEITEYLPADENSFILSHVAARDEIIQYLRNSGKFKVNPSTGNYKDIEAFDLLNIYQVTLASSYLAMAYIYESIFDDPEGLYRNKADRYRSRYTSAISTFYLDLDLDDDGIRDNNEQLMSNTTRIIRR